MDDQALAVIIMDLGHIGIDGDGRQLAHDIQALAQGLVDVGIVRIGVVIVERQQGVLQFVHQVLAGQTQEVHFQKIIGQIVAVL